MAADITNLNLSDGQEIFLPFEVTGDAAGNPGSTNVTAVSWQIDDQEIQEASLNPAPPQQTLQFDFNIPETLCPTEDTWYMLTIYVWDSVNEVTTKNVVFKRLGLSTGEDEGEGGSHG